MNVLRLVWVYNFKVMYICIDYHYLSNTIAGIFDIISEILTKFKNNDEIIIDRKINLILHWIWNEDNNFLNFFIFF